MLFARFFRLARPVSLNMRRLITIPVVIADPASALAEVGMVAPAGALGVELGAAGATPPPVNVSFELTEKEAAVFGVLRDTAAAAGKGTVVRIVGGWVRDKLLRIESSDVDVALDNTTGVEFAGCVNALLTARGEATSSVGVIEANPEQSKHLETAATRVLGEWIDFVGLRAEVYDDESRIPTIKAGTPTQDALRRDFTINSLFFNISTESLEDLTGRGLSDLAARLLRTPLPPLITFRDDPLRVLRAVRFATRLGFAFDESLRVAAADAGVAKNLASKISRERVGIELDGMMGGARPIAAVRTLHALNLAHGVFAPPKAALERLFGALTELPLSSGAVAVPLGAAVAAKTTATRTMMVSTDAAAQPFEGLPDHWLRAGADVVSSIDFLCAALGAEGLAQLCAAPPPIEPGTDGGSDVAVDLLNALVLADAAATAQPETSADHSAALFRVLSRDGVHSLLVAAQLLPLAFVFRAAKGTMSKSTRVADALPSVTLLEGLKRPKKAADDVAALLSGAVGFALILADPEAAAVCRAAAAAGTVAGAEVGRGSPRRDAVVLVAGGLLKRDTRELWRGALVLSAAAQCATLRAAAAAAQGTPASSTEAVVAAARAVLDDHAALANAIAGAWALDGCWAWRPPLNGSELKSALGAAAVSGPAFGALMEEQSQWHLLNPGGSAEGALEHMTRKCTEAGGKKYKS